MKLQHGHTYRTRCGWVAQCTGSNDVAEFQLRGDNVYAEGYGVDNFWWYNADGLFLERELDETFPMHITEEVFDTARASLIESLRNIALAWQEPLAKAHMIALLEIIDELQKPLDIGGEK